MKSELIDVSPTRKEIKIEIEPAAVRQSYDRVSDRYAKLANVPGFRRGHAPRGVVRTRFKSEIRGEVLRELVPDAVNEAIDKHELTTIGEPNVHLEDAETFDRFGDEPISVKVDVEVLPRIELSKYKGLPTIKRVRPVTDENVEEMIAGLREASASLQPVEDRGAQIGDTVTVDFIGKFIDQPEAEDIDVKDVDVELGAERVQPEFNDNLAGMKPDQEKTFVVDYPEDFSSKGLAGKKIEYTAKVTAVRVKELPEVDDEWARSLGEEFDSVATLRTKVREDLEQRAKAESEHRMRRDVMRWLLESHRFEVPDTLVQHQTDSRLQEVLRDMLGRGIDPRTQNLNWESARDELKTQAQEDVRASILLEEIANTENIDVTDEEIEAEITQVAIASRQPRERVHATLTKEGGKRSIANRLRNRKALDLLMENAQVTEEEWREEEPPRDEESAKESATGSDG